MNVTAKETLARRGGMWVEVEREGVIAADLSHIVRTRVVGVKVHRGSEVLMITTKEDAFWLANELVRAGELLPKERV